MLAGQLPWPARSWHSLAASAAVAALVVPLAVRAPAGAQPGLRQVSYRGYSFEVPGSWPVIDLARHPRDCVRLDRHAVYLGAPGRNQSCPSRLIGTTEAVVIKPGAARRPQAPVEDPVSRRIMVAAPRIRVTATFGTNPGQIYQILASAFLPHPTIKAPDPAAAAGRPRAARSARRRQDGAARAARVAAPALGSQVANYRGLGFDTCTAPSAAYMGAWRDRSRYRAIGIYIGGSDEACTQPNLTRGWLRREAAVGWHFLPLYVGPQAAFGELSSRPGRQGHAAADDAAAQARRLGLGPGTPIYYDMEGYPPGQAAAVLRFLSAWTTVLHSLGYSSGAYSSSSSGIADLARQYSSHRYAIPDVIDDALWNGQQNTRDSVYQAGEWVNHRRAHQFDGNVIQTFGGVTLNIDQDFLNVHVHLRPGPIISGAGSAGDLRGRRPRDPGCAPAATWPDCFRRASC
jgi:Domain of unknown function (DUF1906)